MAKETRSALEKPDPRIEGLLARVREDICGELLAINDYSLHAREADLLGMDKMAVVLRQILCGEKEHLAHHIKLLLENDPEQADILAKVLGAAI